ncbi:MAG: hypothetical protein DRJ46_02750 [Thermoprotei archaeon]|nr:MAG: hypothetical protein DRJ46_02750 [Thermoprotei archaeon]
MPSKEELRSKARSEGRFRDDFEEKSPYWDYRVDNYAGFELADSVLRMYMGPTEALYYSNAEIADGVFDDLPWRFKNFKARVRLLGNHYGSAGWGFWNHTMVTDVCQPIWFIYLRCRGPYPLQGFFAQVGNGLSPIIIYSGAGKLGLAAALGDIFESLAGVRIYSGKPAKPELRLDEWHEYEIEWRKKVKFFIDDEQVAEIPFKGGDARGRADAWIDNAVFTWSNKDPGRVYRHATQENRKRSFLEIDYIEIY